MSYKVNIAVQILPLAEPEKIYPLVDEAIRVVQQSGVVHRVCPFETVLEGEYTHLMEVIEDMQQACFRAGAGELLVNLKIQRASGHDVRIEDKMSQYDH
jgi:uncharacterized protein YqgV (UPF0045/DUF77 family)